MEYKNIVKAKFIDRPNRFVAHVELDGKEVAVHVKNTGRCRELLVKDAVVYLEDFTQNMGTRKMAYSLIAVEKKTKDKTLLINMDSQAPNKVVGEALKKGSLVLPGMSGITDIRPESVYGDSRLDFHVTDEKGGEGYIEVKGVTLEEDGIASFPDAPTERGIKHLKELGKIAAGGTRAYAIFVIQMKGMRRFTPNRLRHAAFADALIDAGKAGVTILAYDCSVTPTSLVLDSKVEIRL